MTEVIITVRGTHDVRVAPERATAHITVNGDGPDRSIVLGDVGQRADAVRDDLSARRGAGALAEWSSQRVSVWSDRPWNNDGKQLDLVHHASVSITATFTDFAALSEWLNAVSAHDGIQVGHIDWDLLPDTRARIEREVATTAVSVAVERATAYAAAIGKSTVVAREIADLGLLGSAETATPRAAMMKMSMESADAGGAVDLQPAELVISAGVEARFAAS